MSSNLVQDLVAEMGPNNPALAAGQYQPAGPMMQGQGQGGQQGAPVYNPNYIPQPQGPMMPPPQAGGQIMGQMSGGCPMMPSQSMPSMPPQIDMSQMAQMSGMPPMDPSSYDQMQEIQDMSRFGMDGRHRSLFDRAMDQLRQLLFLAATFVILSLPSIDTFLIRFLPILASNFYYLVAVKGLLLALMFYAGRYFDLI